MTNHSNLRRAVFALALLAVPAAALAHNPDTSYVRVGINERAISIRLTYDIFTLLKIAPLDANGDHRVTREELGRALPAIHGFLRRRVLVEVDDAQADLGVALDFVWPPDAGDAIAEKDYHTAGSLVHFNFRRPVGDLPENVALTFDLFTPLGERHTILGAFECRGAPHEVTFTRFEPDYDFVTGYEPSAWRRLGQFLKLGIGHIFLGYDHVCFLVALILVSRFRELVKIVTSFTVAHSITLILAALDVVRLPTRLVETGIAATIVYVAVENLWVKETRHRWMLTFAFGLIHGFGFANVLREIGLPATGLVRCLLAFNVGVEVGQLAIVATLLPGAIGLARWKHGPKAAAAISVLLALFGAAWCADRAFALGFMPI